MSYARKGPGSDVYVMRVSRFWCLTCSLDKEHAADHSEPDAASMVAHLLAHRDEGHAVPQGAIDRLLVEGASRPKGDSK